MAFLGQGSYGSVYVKKICGVKYAVKIIKIDPKYGIPSNALLETKSLKQLQGCPNIIQLKGTAVIKSPKSAYFIIMELMEHNLRHYIKTYPFDKTNIKLIMMNIINGLVSIHGKNILHRDLKPTNILMNGSCANSIRICDFGLSTIVHVESPLSTNVITYFYRAPEIIFQISDYKFEVDVWSLGCVFAELIIGKPIFDAEKEKKLMKTILKTLKPDFKLKLGEVKITYEEILDISEKYETKLPESLSIIGEEGLDLLINMLEINPKKRITLEAIRHHKYFN